MSGIAGYFRLDGSAAVQSWIDGMVQTMPHRGPDGIHTMIHNSVALGHCMLRVTPESEHASLPWHDRETGLIITSNSRLDNRAWLMKALQVPAHKSFTTTDSALLTRSYRKWGPSCVRHLIGDFTFAIYDTVQDVLLLTRDHMGVKQLYTFIDTDTSIIAFASEIKSLLSLPHVDSAINKDAVLSHLANGTVSKTQTIYKNINRLEPAHTILINPKQNIETKRYWTLSARDISSDLSDLEYTNEFKSIFTESVKCRLRSTFPVGSELSGGLDSSFVTCMADHLSKSGNTNPKTIRTFSTVYNKCKSADERFYINQVLDSGDFIPHYISADEEGLVQLLQSIFEYLDDGRVAGNHHLNWLTARAAGGSDVRVLLTGQDGDSTVYHGWQIFAELAREQRWQTFAELAERSVEIIKSTKNDRTSSQETWTRKEDVLGAYGSLYLVHWAQNGHLIELTRAINTIRQHFSVSSFALFKNLLPFVRDYMTSSLKRDKRKALSDYKIPSFIRSSEIEPIPDELLRDKPHPEDLGVRKSQKNILNSGYLTSSLEKIAHYAAAHGIEPRHPFMDIRLIEYCLGLPSHQSFSEGWSRIIMRRAMKDIVPENIRWRTTKTSLAAPFHHVLFSLSSPAPTHIVADLDFLAPYIDKVEFNTVLDRALTQKDGEAASVVARIVGLLVWANASRK